MRTFLLPVLAGFTFFAHAEDVSVIDFGAISDGTTLTTQAIQDAIDHCHATGGGTVTIPQGTYLTRTIYHRSNVSLEIREGALLLGDTIPGAFNQAIIYGENIENASITGLGAINGRGWAKFFPKDGKRHNDVRFYRCENIRVMDITMLNAPSWVFRILECDGVMVRGVKIYSYVNQNNDGIDIDAKNVTVSDCIVDCEDDAMCLKSDNPDFLCENISISNCILATNCNAIKFGTASHCGFRNIAVSNCVIRRPYGAAKIPPRSTLMGCDTDTIMEIGLALEIVDGGFMHQVTVTNLTMEGIQTPIFIRLGNRRSKNKDTDGNPIPGSLKNVVISNITATDESYLHSSVTGIPGTYVENVIIRDVFLHSKGGGTMLEAEAEVPEKIDRYPQANVIFGYSIPAYGMYVRHVKNLVLENFSFNLLKPDARPAVVMDDCHHIRLRNFDVDLPSNDQALVRIIESTDITLSGYQSVQPVSNFLRLEGETCADIKLFGNDFSRVKKIIDYRKGADESAIKMLSNFK
jgi:hypothetical protein